MFEIPCVEAAHLKGVRLFESGREKMFHRSSGVSFYSVFTLGPLVGDKNVIWKGRAEASTVRVPYHIHVDLKKFTF